MDHAKTMALPLLNENSVNTAQVVNKRLQRREQARKILEDFPPLPGPPENTVQNVARRARLRNNQLQYLETHPEIYIGHAIAPGVVAERRAAIRDAEGPITFMHNESGDPTPWARTLEGPDSQMLSHVQRLVSTSKNTDTLKSLVQQLKRVQARQKILENQSKFRKTASIKKNMAVQKRVAAKIKRDISAEKKRIDSEKKATDAKNRAEREARKKEEAALRSLKESKIKAASQKAKQLKDEESRKKAMLDAKRRAEKERKQALVQMKRDEKNAAANKARLEFEKARAKKERGEIARRAAKVAKQKVMLEEKGKRDKQEFKARKDRQRQLVTEEAKRKTAEAKRMAEMEKAAARRLAEVTDENESEVLRKKTEKQKRDFREKQKEAARQRENVARVEERKMLAKKQKEAAKLERMKESHRREQTELANQEKAAEARDKQRATNAARVAADQKQRQDARKKKERKALALKHAQLALEKKNAVESANAKAAAKKAKADVVTKKASARQKGLDRAKAQAEKRQHVREARAKGVRKKTGDNDMWDTIQKITGLSRIQLGRRDAVAQLDQLDHDVLERLSQYLETLDEMKNGQVPTLKAILKLAMWRKELFEIGGEIGIDFAQMKPDKIDANSLGIDDLEKFIEHIKSFPKKTGVPRFLASWKAILQRKTGKTPGEEKQERARVEKREIMANIERITGIPAERVRGVHSLAILDSGVLHQVLEYFRTLDAPFITQSIPTLVELFIAKKLVEIGEETGVALNLNVTNKQMGGLERMDMIGLGKMMEFLEEHGSTSSVASGYLVRVKCLHLCEEGKGR
ncbi:EsV-1-13 [Ectocarpus siliculosus]|uniref:EsV-1-13 n=1 Tax=Ectocarpus siliculosus TaxID=2880 RepID=D7G324_ECTSI|nr:EsV-1-13 [Ectocarpus siliculosus]|eukprot:CBJ33467.1 EsV-1-13 [Ectocarpus siliculosus]